MEELDERVIRFDLFRDNFQYAFDKLEDHFKTNKNVRFFFDEEWNLLAKLNDESVYFAPDKRAWMKIL